MTARLWTWALGAGAVLVAVLTGVFAVLMRRPQRLPAVVSKSETARQEEQRENVEALRAVDAVAQAEVVAVADIDDERERLEATARLRG